MRLLLAIYLLQLVFFQLKQKAVNISYNTFEMCPLTNKIFEMLLALTYVLNIFCENYDSDTFVQCFRVRKHCTYLKQTLR